MSERIHLSKADVSEVEEQYVLRALRSGWVAPAGPDITAFEREVAQRVSVDHAVGLSSGTAALHLALASWGVRQGDVVPVSTFTFAATVNAIRYVGAQPHFIDCDESSGNIAPSLLRQALEQLGRSGKNTPAIVSVDMFGKSVDYDAISAIAKDFGVRVLCDAAESFGSTYKGRATGSFGDAGIVSFNGNKIMTTSGGGMLLTNDDVLATHVRKLSTQAREPVDHYEHTEIGYNYRLSNILAALGRAQLTRLNQMIARRRHWRSRYRQLFEGVPGVIFLGGADDSEDNCWLTVIIIDPSVATFTAGLLRESLDTANIESRRVWKPMHLQPVFAGFGGELDGSAAKLFERGLTLPSGSSMTEDQFERVERAIVGVIR